MKKEYTVYVNDDYSVVSNHLSYAIMYNVHCTCCQSNSSPEKSKTMEIG